MGRLVLGIDSSTQSVKAQLVDADSGEVVDQASTGHPAGTEVDPAAWTTALDTVVSDLLPRADAVAVSGQQHGMVALDDSGEVVRDALLWNDNRSADAAVTLIEELGGPQRCAEQVGSVLVASFTSTKLRWMRDHEPDNAARTSTVLLPHDYLTRHLSAGRRTHATDRSDASGTGYWSPVDNDWRPDLAASALGHDIELPTIGAADRPVAETDAGALLGPGTGDNAGAALGLALRPGKTLVSLGTSGVASTVSESASADATGMVACFADATGNHLPLSCTINCARILESVAGWLAVDYDELARLALASESGAGGVRLLPYLDGERTPNRPQARATFDGLSTTTTREHLARAAYEALLCSLADATEALDRATGVPTTEVLLIGGAARSHAIRTLAPSILGVPVTVPEAGEYVARGAARQAAWMLTGGSEPPQWAEPAAQVFTGEPTPEVLEAYRDLRDRTVDWR